MDYAGFDIADFAADEHFVSWVLHPDEQSDAFWNRWSAEHPEKSKILYEARLLVLLMNSRRLRLEDDQKENLWDAIQQKAFEGEELLQEEPEAVPQNRFTLWWKVAASVALIVAATYFFPFNLTSSQTIVHNPKGKKSVLYLPDGTKVWLNAESRLSYPESFEKLSVREVELEGEAFFDVTENKAQPFIVKTSQLQVKVLGTAFNVKSYENQNTIETTLVRGLVMIELNENTSDQHPEKPIFLKENEQAVYSTVSKELSLHKIKTEPVTDWKEGKLSFVNRPFSEIERELERWYGVEIILENETSSACRFSTTIENEPINKILELFRTTSGITYEIQNNTIRINGNLCGNSESEKDRQ